MKNSETEQSMTDTMIETWNRVRSSNELKALIARREFALAAVEDIDA